MLIAFFSVEKKAFFLLAPLVQCIFFSWLLTRRLHTRTLSNNRTHEPPYRPANAEKNAIIFFLQLFAETMKGKKPIFLLTLALAAQPCARYHTEFDIAFVVVFLHTNGKNSIFGSGHDDDEKKSQA